MVLKYNFGWSGQLQVCDSMKYKCFKSECPICHSTGSIQLFLNNKSEVRYARTRHYSKINKDSKKPQFTYCKIEDLESLKDLLKTQSISLTTEKAIDGQVGHKKNNDPVKPENSLNQQNRCGRRLVWFRTLAFQANDHGFKSRRPHHNFNSIKSKQQPLFAGSFSNI